MDDEKNVNETELELEDLDNVIGGHAVVEDAGIFTTKAEAEQWAAKHYKVGAKYYCKRKFVTCIGTGAVSLRSGSWYGVLYYRTKEGTEGYAIRLDVR